MITQIQAEQPLRKVDAYSQVELGVFDYYLECGHIKTMPIDEHPDNVWMLRCPHCPPSHG